MSFGAITSISPSSTTLPSCSVCFFRAFSRTSSGKDFLREAVTAHSILAAIVSSLRLSFMIVSKASTFFIRGVYTFPFGSHSSFIPEVVSVSSLSHSDNKPSSTKSLNWGKQVPQNHILSSWFMYLYTSSLMFRHFVQVC